MKVVILMENSTCRDTVACAHGLSMYIETDKHKILFDMGPDYARTLAHWRQRFVHAWQEIEKLGFDERFRRMWLYYFGYCEAGFNARTISVVQLTAERTS